MHSVWNLHSVWRIDCICKEDDVERKIFIDNALDTMVSLTKGSLEDGDGKKNESIATTPCSTLSENLCMEAGILFEKTTKECLTQAISVLNGESNEQSIVSDA